MKIAVCVKHVPDATVHKRIDPTTKRLDRSGESALNPTDLNAVEEALRVKEAQGGEVVLVSLGPAKAADSLRKALAMGADRAVLVSDEGAVGSDLLGTSRVLAAVRVPTLVVHRETEREPAEYFAERVADCRLVSLPELRGAYTWINDATHELVMRSCSQFVAGLGQDQGRERILATIVFTDIVGATRRAAFLGDAEWRDLLTRHHAVVRGFLARHRGRSSTPPATASSRPLTAPVEPLPARGRSAMAYAISGWRSGWESTRVNARSSTASPEACPSSSARASARTRTEARYSSRERFVISWQAPGFPSPIAASTSSRASRARGGSTRSSMPEAPAVRYTRVTTAPEIIETRRTLCGTCAFTSARSNENFLSVEPGPMGC